MVSMLTRTPDLRRKVAASVFCVSLVAFAPRGGVPQPTESIVVGTLRSVVSAEASYAAVNGGLYDVPSCLATPSCIPGLRQRPARFWAPDLSTNLERHGYRLEFHAGPKARPVPAHQSPSSMSGFAFVAMPMSSENGVKRAFCVDDRGPIYVTADGTRPRVEAGRCADTSQPLR